MPHSILSTPLPSAEGGQHAEGPCCLQPVYIPWIFTFKTALVWAFWTVNSTCQLSPGAQMHFCYGYFCHICKSASSSRLFRYFSCKDKFMCAKTSYYKIFCKAQKSSTQGVTRAMWNCLFMLCPSKLTPSHQEGQLKIWRLLVLYWSPTGLYLSTCNIWILPKDFSRHVCLNLLRRGEILKYKVMFSDTLSGLCLLSCLVCVHTLN